jgi:hypothetical protein
MTTSRPTSVGLRVLAAGLLLGALADVAMRATPWGLNATLVAAAGLVLTAELQRRQQTDAGPRAVVGAVAAALVAVGFCWRDATVLKTLDALMLAAILALAASERRGQSAARTLSTYLARMSGTLLHALGGTPVLLAEDVPWSDVPAARVFPFGLRVVRGLLLAAPVVFVFMILLAHADAIFAAGLLALLDVDLAWLVGHLLGTLVCTWIAAGLLRAAVLRRSPLHGAPARPAWLGLGAVEVAVVLGLVDALFAAFVWVQVRYLFGGATWVQATAGLSYAEYARRGFFELVAVTALVLPLLLVSHWLSETDPRARRVFSALAGAQVLLVLVMLASALERMRLYRGEYGLTQLRLYTTAFMIWLGALLVWFALTVLPGRRGAFAPGALASVLVAVAALHAFDPDRRILETNRDHVMVSTSTMPAA